jgi:hypothetical protein
MMKNRSLVGFDMLLALAFLHALVVRDLFPAQDFSFEQRSAHVYDVARIIATKEFRGDTLLRVFRRFVDSECGRRVLVRLTVSTNQRDLANAINTNLPNLTSNFLLLAQGLGEPNVAQVMCFGSDASAVIRRGTTVMHYQIAGTRDTRELPVAGAHVTFVGFRLRAEPSGSSDANPLPERLWIYGKADHLPDTDRASSIRRELERLTGVRTYLILRTDPFFFDYDGPVCDIFEHRLPKIIPEQFLRVPYVVCSPDQTCRLLDSH